MAAAKDKSVIVSVMRTIRNKVGTSLASGLAFPPLLEHSMKKTLTLAALCLPMLCAPYAWAQSGANNTGNTTLHPNVSKPGELGNMGPNTSSPARGAQQHPRDGSHEGRIIEHPAQSSPHPGSDICAGPGALNNPRCTDSQSRRNPAGSSAPRSVEKPGLIPDRGQTRERPQ